MTIDVGLGRRAALTIHIKKWRHLKQNEHTKYCKFKNYKFTII